MIRRLFGVLVFAVLIHPLASTAAEPDYLTCKQQAYDNLMSRYQNIFPDQAQTITEAQGDKAMAAAAKYEDDYNRAQTACATKFPERNATAYKACVRKRSKGQAIDCESTYPERDVAAYNKCLDGAVNAGVTRFNKNFAKDAQISNKPEAQALIAQYQADYAKAVADCANLRDTSPINSAITSCESLSSSASASCSSDGSDEGLSQAPADGGSGGGIAGVCAQTAAKTSAAVSALSSAQSSCKSSVSSCQSACSQAESQIANLPEGQQGSFRSRIPTVRAPCTTAASRLSTLNQALARARGSLKNSQDCTKDAARDQAVAAACNADPAECASARKDCSNPAFAAGNPLCGNTQTPRLGDGSGNQDFANHAIDSSSSAPLALGDSHDFGGASGGVGGDGSSGGGALSPLAIPAMAPGPADPLAGTVATAGTENSGPGAMSSAANSAGPAAKSSAADGKKVAALRSPLPTVENDAGGGLAFGASAKEPGSYRNNGSWIPPKVGTKSNHLEDLNLDRFRPSLQGYRQPASKDPRAQLLASDVNIWKQINQQYLSQGRSLGP